MSAFGKSLTIAEGNAGVLWEAYEFLRLLNSELRAAFHAGWEVSGSWGKVEDRAGDLHYALKPVDDVEDPNFVEAVDEEL